MQVVEELRTILQQEKAIEAAVLFGSHAAGRAGPGSDLDVAVWLDGRLNREALEAYRLQLSLLLMDRFHCAVDLVVLDVAPPFLQQQVFNKGLELFARDGAAWSQFRIKSHMAAFSMRHLMDIQFAADRRRIAKEIGHG